MYVSSSTMSYTRWKEKPTDLMLGHVLVKNGRCRVVGELWKFNACLLSSKAKETRKEVNWKIIVLSLYDLICQKKKFVWFENGQGFIPKLHDIQYWQWHRTWHKNMSMYK
jgi:hypothetical protein